MANIASALDTYQNKSKLTSALCFLIYFIDYKSSIDSINAKSIMNLRDLRYLVAVADFHSFIHAADHCFISQPTLSTQIKKLEDDLGVRIFERTHKKVLPTELGEQIIASARRILLEIDSIQQIASNAQDPLSGDFRLGAIPTLSTYIFPGLVPKIKQALPKLRLILIEEKTDTLITQLREGQLDAAIMALPVHDNYLDSRTLFEDEFFLAVASDHPLAKRKKISHHDLFQQQLLLLDEGHCLRGQALEFCRINHAEDHQDVRATGLETLRQMVKAGTGITFMPKIAIHEPEEGICYIRFKDPAPKRTIGLCWRKTSAKKVLLDMLSEFMAISNL